MIETTCLLAFASLASLALGFTIYGIIRDIREFYRNVPDYAAQDIREYKVTYDNYKDS